MKGKLLLTATIWFLQLNLFSQNIYNENNCVSYKINFDKFYNWIDLRSDGHPDLLYKLSYPSKLVIVPNVKGKLLINLSDTIQTNSNDFYGWINWNHDNNPDAIMDEIVLRTNENGTWTKETTNAYLNLIGDLDLDSEIERICRVKNKYGYGAAFNYYHDNNEDPIPSPIKFSNVIYSTLVDLNEDGRKDFYMPRNSSTAMCVYNYPDGFVEFETSIPSHYKAKYDFFDFNGDGQMDILRYPQNSEFAPEIWIKNNNDWQLHHTFPLVQSPNISIGDIDNNGYPDIILGGQFVTADRSIAAIYLNDGSTLSRKIDGLPSNINSISDISLIDFNNDGNLDLSIKSYDSYVIYLNNLAPTSKTATINNIQINYIGDKLVEFSWDQEAQSNNYSYNLSLKQGKKYLIAPFTNKNGKRKIKEKGNMGYARKVVFQLPKDTIFDISVQRVDNAFRTSAPSVIQQFMPLGSIKYDNIFSENKPKGSVVGSIVSGNEITDTYTYKLVNGEGDTHNNLFFLEGETLKSNKVIDYETTPVCSLRIRIENNEKVVLEKVLLVEISDLPEPPSDIVLNSSRIFIDEPAGMDIAKIWAADMDKDEKHTWTIPNNSSGDASYFYIKNGYLHLAKELDETERSYSFTVRVVDSQNNAFEKQISIEAVLDALPDKQPLGPFSNDYKNNPGSVTAFGNIIAVGYPHYESSNSKIKGKVTLFRRQLDGWKKLQDLYSNEEKYHDDAYGYNVSLSLNYLAVGTDENRVYIYKRVHDRFIYQTTLNGQINYGDFGKKLAITDDYLTVGDARINSAYKYKNMNNGQWQLISSLRPNHLPERAAFGYAVDSHGEHAIIGAYTNAAETYYGRASAHIYNLETNESAIDIPYPHPITDLVGSFGYDVAINDSHYGVLAESVKYNMINHGAVYIYPYSNNIQSTYYTTLALPDTLEKHTASHFKLSKHSCVIAGNKYLKIYMEDDGYWNYVKKIELDDGQISPYKNSLALTRKFAATISDDQGLIIHSCNSIGYKHKELAPFDLYCSNYSITEELPAYSVVGQLTGLDYNMNSKLRYKLDKNNGKGHNHLFYIDGDTLKTSKPIDFEKYTKCTIHIKVEDETGLSILKKLEININNIADNIGEYKWSTNSQVISYDLDDNYAVALTHNHEEKKLEWFKKGKYSWCHAGTITLPSQNIKAVQIDQDMIICIDNLNNLYYYKITDEKCLLISSFTVKDISQISNFDFKNSRLLLADTYGGTNAEGNIILLKYDNNQWVSIASVMGTSSWEQLGIKCAILKDGIALTNSNGQLFVWQITTGGLNYVSEIKGEYFELSRSYPLTAYNNTLVFKAGGQLHGYSLSNNKISREFTKELTKANGNNFANSSLPVSLQMSEKNISIGYPNYSGEDRNQGNVSVLSLTQDKEITMDTIYQPSDIKPNSYYGYRHKLSSNSIMSVSRNDYYINDIYFYILPHSQSVNINENQKLNMLSCSVGPIPSNNNLFIKINDNAIGDVHITLYCMNGKLLHQDSLYKEHRYFQHQINIGKLQRGHYLLKVKVKNIEKILKIQKI